MSLVLGLSFYPLEQASKHGDLCNEQIRDSNERSNLSCGFLFAQALIADARRRCQKIHLRTGGCNFSGSPPSSEKVRLLSLFGGVHS
jgi:hypothetical protein